MKETYLSKYKNNFHITLLVLSIFLTYSCRKQILTKNDDLIKIDKESKTIFFEAKLVYNNSESQEKYFLFYFEGYPWLKNLCFFESSATLKNLQTSIATIDWQLWDKIYTQNFSPNVDIYISTSSQPYHWTKLDKILNTNFFATKQVIFWGSYLYDDVVLNNNYNNSKCSTCQLLPLEQNLFLYGLTPIKIVSKSNLLENVYYKFKIVFK